MITPVLLCGGSGTRLWPLSRESYPKQFSKLFGDQSLFQATAQRFSSDVFAAPMLVTAHDFRFIVTEQLAGCEIAPHSILVEPAPRNTAPAALAAALVVSETDPDALLLLAPSDHVIPDADLFCKAVQDGMDAAQSGQIVTFGIRPTRAEPGYGWLERADAEGLNAKTYPLNRFIEKPDQALADRLFKDPKYSWNAGVFLVSARSLIAAFTAHAPEVFAMTRAAVLARETDLGFTRLGADEWENIPNISIDYAVMEKSENLSVVPYEGDWSDLGSWDAVWQESEKDRSGNAVRGPASALECSNTLLRAESEDIEIVGIGLDNIAAIAMGDAVLVADMSKSQSVKLAVDHLKTKSRKQATAFPVDHRPWGWFETLIGGDRFQVKRIHIHPGASLSLQKHLHRAEHWIVVTGTVLATVDDVETLVSENESLYVPLASIHRLQNPGKLPVVLIEVQTGSYLGEDDIIRLDDVYKRET